MEDVGIGKDYKIMSRLRLCRCEADSIYSFFFFNVTATTENYTRGIVGSVRCVKETAVLLRSCQTTYQTSQNAHPKWRGKDRANPNADCKHKTVDGLALIHISEPTRQEAISYAVFCLEKKKTIKKHITHSSNTPPLLHFATPLLIPYQT
ncbi:hypothetical protein AMBR_JPGBJEAN_02773 [Lacticaseibacillus rhamnosus]|nr:hypothetical protein AMBR_JPGBJEAN_02773 [Lacticaseibacillus rhamnosus]